MELVEYLPRSLSNENLLGTQFYCFKGHVQR